MSSTISLEGYNRIDVESEGIIVASFNFLSRHDRTSMMIFHRSDRTAQIFSALISNRNCLDLFKGTVLK
jgi:hypothetical protein